MKIRYVLGDLLISDEKILIHGCNAHGVQNSGIAKLIRERFPEAFAVYRDAYEAKGLILGEVIWAESNGKLIGNAITQKNYGRDPKIVYANYQAIEDAMTKINAKVGGVHQTVGLPLIGAGLANGDWSIISKIIAEKTTDVQPVVYILEPNLFEKYSKY